MDRTTLRLVRLTWAGLLVQLVVLERRMQATGGPGIIPFELAGTPKRTKRMMRTWGRDGRAAARASLLLDFPFLATYSVLQYAMCASAGDRLRRSGNDTLATGARVIAPAQVAAGACDAVENTSLLLILGGRMGRLPQAARAFALAKFALLTVGGLYAALAAIVARRA